MTSEVHYATVERKTTQTQRPVDDASAPNLSQLNINRAFGVFRTDEFDNEYYGDGE
jgi:hypothetical protein